MTDCKPLPTPTGSKSTVLNKAEKKLYDDPTAYRSLVGALQYLTTTKPKIQYAVNTLCQKMQVPTNVDFAALKKVLIYVKGTLTQGLLFTPGPLTLTAYSDSD